MTTVSRGLTPVSATDAKWMHHTVHMTQLAVASSYAAPFGAIIVDATDKLVIGRVGTGTASLSSGHCELEAIRAAEGFFETLWGCSIYSTHEPCAMCCGAIIHAKLARVIWGSSRSDLPEIFHRRAVGHRARSLLRDCSTPPEIVAGVLQPECVQLLRGWVKEGHH